MSRIFKLSEVMRFQTVTISDDGYEMENIAGKAFYSVSGLRGKVEGIPEYFPIILKVSNLRKPEKPKAEPSNGSQNLESRAADAETLSGRIMAEGHICGNTIEQETLLRVLASSLHNVSPDRAGDVAVQLAGAVKSAFHALDCPADAYIKNHVGKPLFGEKPCKTEWSIKTEQSIPEFKVFAKGDEREISTLMLKLELDTSDALQSLDDLRDVISGLVKEEIKKAIKPGGALPHASPR
ncbi:hypothetical protein [Raoultella planticola]|uniref:hypothetical protein n=1 Tax=Raoultella planticola TaxID=575 RepID=UPI00374AE4B8